MEIIGCGKGHYYNPELYSSCPECAKERGRADTLGATEFVEHGHYPDHDSDIGTTEPVFFGRVPENLSDISKTAALDYEGFARGRDSVGKTESVANGAQVLNTYDFKDSQEGSKVQDYEPTTYLGPNLTQNTPKKGIPFLPVVGWLVCVDGPAKGRDYRIHTQKNLIGRGHHMDICISGDNSISAEQADCIAYDPKNKFFYFIPGAAKNIAYVNAEPAFTPVALKPYDILSIGQTKLMFVPLCGERFDWDDK